MRHQGRGGLISVKKGASERKLSKGERIGLAIKSLTRNLELGGLGS